MTKPSENGLQFTYPPQWLVLQLLRLFNGPSEGQSERKTTGEDARKTMGEDARKTTKKTTRKVTKKTTRKVTRKVTRMTKEKKMRKTLTDTTERGVWLSSLRIAN